MNNTSLLDGSLFEQHEAPHGARRPATLGRWPCLDLHGKGHGSNRGKPKTLQYRVARCRVMRHAVMQRMSPPARLVIWCGCQRGCATGDSSTGPEIRSRKVAKYTDPGCRLHRHDTKLCNMLQAPAVSLKLWRYSMEPVTTAVACPIAQEQRASYGPDSAKYRQAHADDGFRLRDVHKISQGGLDEPESTSPIPLAEVAARKVACLGKHKDVPR